MGQLQVVGVDVTTQDGNTLFISAMQAFNVKQVGVPFLVIDDIYLIGSTDIPVQFPTLVQTLVQTYLAQGGVDFPNILGLQEAISTDASLQMETLHSTPLPASTAPVFPAPTVMPDVNGGDIRWTEKFMRDPVGNTLSVIILLGMLGSLGWGIAFFRKGDSRTTQQAEWARIIPMLCVIGFGVAGYWLLSKPPKQLRSADRLGIVILSSKVNMQGFLAYFRLVYWDCLDILLFLFPGS